MKTYAVVPAISHCHDPDVGPERTVRGTMNGEHCPLRWHTRSRIPGHSGRNKIRAAGVIVIDSRATQVRLRRREKPRPASPMPKGAIVAGSASARRAGTFERKEKSLAL